MKAYEVQNYLKEIESKSFDYQTLLTYDYLFEVKGSELDDNNLIHAIADVDLGLLETYCKLRGSYDETPKLADSTNDSEYCHGYILFTVEPNVDKLEKNLIVTALKNTISVRKIPVKLIKEEIKQRNEDLFNSLFEIIE
jgi:hypothetical protein